MRIDRAEVLVSCPGRNYVTLRLWTDTGLFGLGDATLNGRELAVASYLQDHVLPLLSGRDADRIEDTWQFLYRGAYWRRGPVTMSAIAAVDVALWDLKAKSLGIPLYQLLGGSSREGVLVYAHAAGTTPEQTREDVERQRELGYLAVRAQCLIPGSSGSYGVASHGQAFDPTHPGSPEEGRFSVEAYLRFAPRLFDYLRSAVGEDVHLLHDAHHRLTPIEAARLGRDLEPFRLFWLEDPVEAELQESFRIIRHHTTTPIAVGEVFNSIWDVHELIREQLIDYVRTSVLRGGGITHLRKIAALAELHHVRIGFHGFNDLSPVTMAAALHFDLWVPNFGIQEHRGHPSEAAEVFRTSYRFEGGYMHPGDAPGLGVTYDDQVASRYEYRPAYLPIVRKLDGTMFNW